MTGDVHVIGPNKWPYTTFNGYDIKLNLILGLESSTAAVRSGIGDGGAAAEVQAGKPAATDDASVTGGFGKQRRNEFLLRSEY